MRKFYVTVEMKFEYFETSDVMTSSTVPTGINNEGTIFDGYDDSL